MLIKPSRGLFITGTDTEVGKTYVASLIVKSLVAAGHRVGVYKPVASDCVLMGQQLVAEDAVVLWEAAGLITVGGSPGAHLFEVAAWLGVPAVCDVDLERATDLALADLRHSRDFVCAIDGNAGVVWLHRLSSPRT